MIFAFTPLLLSLWTRQAAALKEPNAMHKIVIGCLLLAFSFALIAFAAHRGAGGKISWLWLGLFFAIITTGEIYLSPISQSLYSKVAPLRITSIMMAVNFAPNFLGGGLMQGWLGTFWQKMDHTSFFLMIAAIGLAAAVIVWLLEKPLRPHLEISHE
jgi:POT family proton-dependent oligopeptide transporter